MSEKIRKKGFIISVIGRDSRKTPEPEENHKGDPGRSASDKENIEKNKNLSKGRTHYRIEYTKDGPKIWTLH